MSSPLHIDNPARPAYPFPALTTHSASSAYDLSSSSVDIQGIRRFSNTRMTPMAGTWRRTTIEMLSEDTLLEIFDFYRFDATKQSRGGPWKWHRLAHVCQKWRHVISMSPRRLDLRVLCKSGKPVESILSSWPIFPLVVKFKGVQKSKLLPKNVLVALRHPDRLCEIDLQVTSSMTGPIVEAIQKPCQALESLRITVKDATEPSGTPQLVRNAFLGGSTPHLRHITLGGISFPFPEIRRVLLSTNNLVELCLYKIPNGGYFSPDALLTSLSGLVHLRKLLVGFHFPSSYPLQSTTPPQRTTLPSLTSLEFLGANEYLEELVARIDSPALRKITIRLFNQIFFEIPQFCQFISHLNGLRSPTRVELTHSAEFFNVRMDSEVYQNCFLGTPCTRLDWQLSFATQILGQLSPLLSGVLSLKIEKGFTFPTGEEDVDSTQWLELFRPFTHVRTVYVTEQLVPGIVQALVTEDVATEVLPELTRLRLKEYRKSSSVAKVADQFVATRRLSGRRVALFD